MFYNYIKEKIIYYSYKIKYNKYETINFLNQSYILVYNKTKSYQI